jgi:hypothetical protein
MGTGNFWERSMIYEMRLGWTGRGGRRERHDDRDEHHGPPITTQLPGLRITSEFAI